MVAEGKENEGLKAAQKIALDEIEKLSLEDVSRALADVPLEDTIKAGSYERMTGLITGGRGFQH